jgi:antitoxin component YwqK of YwqJK toxin-antitoxin module
MNLEYWENGAVRYEGDWKDDAKHGAGVVHD